MTNVTWPLVRSMDDALTLDEIKDALNSLHERLSAIESKDVSSEEITDAFENRARFTPADRAMLTEVGQFLGVHSAVATAVGNAETAAPVNRAPAFGNTETPLTGA